MNHRPQGVSLQARLIPFHSSISAEAQAVLERLVGTDGVPLNAFYEMPRPDDHAAWLAMKGGADVHYAASVKALAGSPRLTVETVTIDHPR